MGGDSSSDYTAAKEYVIQAERAAAAAGAPYRNRVQLNGSVRPGWFPSYTLVVPHVAGCITRSDDPSAALHVAWRLCSPRHFDVLAESTPC